MATRLPHGLVVQDTQQTQDGLQIVGSVLQHVAAAGGDSSGFQVDLASGNATVNALSAASLQVAGLTVEAVTEGEWNGDPITTDYIVDEAVTTAKLAANAVTGTRLADAAVATAHLADASVTSAKLADDAVVSAKLAVGAVETAALADDAVTADKLTDGAVGTAALADDAVTGAQLADAAVATAHLADANVTSAKLADDAVISTKLAAGAVETAALADDAVTAAKLADGAVGTAALADGAVTAAKLADITASAAELNVLDGAAAGTATEGHAPIYGADGALKGTLADAAQPNVTSLGTQAADLNMGGNAIQNLQTPVDAADAATKQYVDNVAQNLDPKQEVYVVAVDAVDLAVDVENGLEVDGVTLATGNTLLLVAQADATENGAYVVPAAAGDPARVAGLDTGASARGAYFFVMEGDTYAGAGFVCTCADDADTVGTDDLTFVQFNGAGQTTAGDGLSKSGNTLSVDAVLSNVTGVGTLTAGTWEADPIASAYIADGAIVEDKLDDDAVTAAKLATGAVGADALASSAVTEAKLDTAAVTGTKLANAVVATAHLVDANVTEVKIADEAVTTAKLAADAVTGAQLADAAVATAHLVDAAVTEEKVADAAVTTAKLANGAVTAAKLATITAVGALASGSIADGFGNIDNGTSTLSTGAATVASLNVSDGGITNAGAVSGTTSVAIDPSSTSGGALTITNSAEQSSGALVEITGEDGQVAVQVNAGHLDMGGNAIQDVQTPVNATDAATKQYVDNVAQNLDPKQEVHVVATAAVNLAVDVEDGMVVDTVNLSTGDTLLLVGQADATENGAYVVPATAGDPARVAGLDTGASARGAYFFVMEGDTYAGAGFVCTCADDADTVGIDDLTFVQFNGAGQTTAGTGLSKSGNTLSVDASLTHVTGLGTVTAGTWNADAIASAYIADSAVTGSKLATGAVSVEKLATGAVTVTKLGANAVSETKIANGAVTEDKLATGAVTEAKLGAAAVATAKIADSAVTEDKLGTAAVATAKIADSAVTEDKLGAAAVATAKIADSAVTEDKIGAAAVTEAKLGAAAVTEAKLGAAAVTEAKLDAAAVTTAKIADDAVTSDKIADGAVSTAHVSWGTDTINVVPGVGTTADLEDGTRVSKVFDPSTFFLRLNFDADSGATGGVPVSLPDVPRAGAVLKVLIDNNASGWSTALVAPSSAHTLDGAPAAVENNTRVSFEFVATSTTEWTFLGAVAVPH